MSSNNDWEKNISDHHQCYYPIHHPNNFSKNDFALTIRQNHYKTNAWNTVTIFFQIEFYTKFSLLKICNKIYVHFEMNFSVTLIYRFSAPHKLLLLITFWMIYLQTRLWRTPRDWSNLFVITGVCYNRVALLAKHSLIKITIQKIGHF